MMGLQPFCIQPPLFGRVWTQKNPLHLKQRVSNEKWIGQAKVYSDKKRIVKLPSSK